jgi:hypothetical protein
MKPEHDEELRQLFKQFLSSEQADNGINDILAGEQILREHPAPEPDPEVLANIKATTTLVAYRHTRIHRVAYRIAVAAAAVMVLTAVATKFWENKTERGQAKIYSASILSTSIWDSGDIATSDPNLAYFNSEINQIEQQLKNLQSGNNSGGYETTLDELQMKLAEINSDFWKG